MIAGVLASVAACLVSGGRTGGAGWPFAFFGGPWGFGGSISYMYPISSAAPSNGRPYSRLLRHVSCRHAVGGLGMGAALPAVMERKRLNDFMVPTLFVLTVMGLSNLYIQPWLETAITVPETVYLGGSFFVPSMGGFQDIVWWPGFVAALALCAFLWWRVKMSGWHRLAGLAAAASLAMALNAGIQWWLLNTRTLLEAGTLADMHMDSAWNRHQSPLYWFDADWFPALAALAGVCLFDLWDRRFAGGRYLVLFAGLGAGGGALLYGVFSVLGINALLARTLVIVTGDPNGPFSIFSFLSNWPNFAHYYPQHLGWLLGLGLGIGLYFYFWGAWRRESRLLLYLAAGWLLAFLMMPVLGSIPLQFMGGFRLTPPRSDDWAGILGVFIAGMLYCRRYGLGGVALAGSLSGLIGGFFFAFVPFLRALLRLPGHPGLNPDSASGIWAHYQSANWHSIMEQMHGFGHGVALAVALGVVAVFIKPHDDDRDASADRNLPLFCFSSRL